MSEDMFEAKQWAWIEAMKAKGHEPKLDSDGLAYFAYVSGDHHNGPACSTCGEGWCWHCYSPEVIEPCKRNLKNNAAQ
jgi:hypothetical protein